MSVVKRRIFPESFKREAVDRVATSGLSAGAVARELGLHETVLRRWMTQFGTQATGTPRRPNTQAVAPSPSDLVAEVVRLRRDNDRLRMERDILKKAALIFGSASR
jgi:transposase